MSPLYLLWVVWDDSEQSFIPIIWQKYYQNGEWLRQAESGGEANYDMVDGRVNNLPKQPEKTKAKKRKKKESVIGKLHKKQIEIAIRSGKPIPKYLEQNRELNRR